VAQAQIPREKWRVWIEPKFMHAAIGKPITGAQRTEFVAGTLEQDGLTPLLRGGLNELGVTWETFLDQARINAGIDLQDLQGKFVRNNRNVIEYAEVRSKKGVIPSAVLAPRFLDPYLNTLGPSILLVIPNRYIAFAFPKLASDYQAYSDMVLSAYRATSFPVSLEVFEVSAQGVRAFGTFSDPGRD
jgi:hypothetical protein